MINVGIVGSTGYTGIELVKIINSHPDCALKWLTAKIDSDEIHLENEFPFLKPYGEFICHNFSPDNIPDNLDVVFLAIPHTVSVKMVPLFLNKKIKVIDLSADFRLNNPKTYESWYKSTAPSGDLLSKAVYGLPELYSEKIKNTTLIANPGCFPTSVILGLAPLAKEKIILDDPVIIDSKTGVTGAGRKATLPIIFPECANNITPYKIARHQHQPEMEQELTTLAQKNIKTIFVPQLVPIERGILSTMYVKIKDKYSQNKLIDLYKNFYKNCPFVFLIEDTYPELKNVTHTNNCHIGIQLCDNIVIIISAIDNLLKGAAGQAVQNMNIMFKLPQEHGLK